jgi:hypothetical protein
LLVATFQRTDSSPLCSLSRDALSSAASAPPVLLSQRGTAPIEP